MSKTKTLQARCDNLSRHINKFYDSDEAQAAQAEQLLRTAAASITDVEDSLSAAEEILADLKSAKPNNNDLEAVAKDVMLTARKGSHDACLKVVVNIFGYGSGVLNETIETLLETIPRNRGFRVLSLDYSDQCGHGTLEFYFWSEDDASNACEIANETVGCSAYMDLLEGITSKSLTTFAF